MIRNYFKIALRNLWKNKSYSALNIFGLAIGITCASLIFLWVEDELHFDTFITAQEDVFYVPTNQKYEGEWRTFNSTPGPLAMDLKNEIPEISKIARTSSEKLLFTVGDNAINSQGRYADPDFLNIFEVTFIEGNAKNALDDLNSIVLTQETAKLLFGNDNAVLGKTIQVNNSETYKITGVVKNLPTNVTYNFGWLIPFKKYMVGAEWMTEYGSNFADTFVKLAPNTNFELVNNKVRKMIPSKTGEPDTQAILHSVKDWHLRSEFKDGKVVGGRIEYVRLFALIAFIILLIACINFMNLATARSEKRANEVGVRKALGSGKKQLISQFITEAILTSILAAFLSVLLLFILLPQFNILVEKDLSLGLLKPLHFFSLLFITLACGFFAGLYPAFYLSSFKPVEVLKGVRTKMGSATYIRKGLVIIQFVVSIVFIISTIVVYQQVQYVKSRDLGYTKENLIKLPVNGDIVKNFKPIQQDLISSGLIKNVALSNSEILSGGNNGSGLEWQGGTNTEDVLISFRYVSSDFLETTGMQLIEGRDFSDNMAKDSTNILISESFAKLMGNDNVLGKTITRNTPFTIIGVVKNYQYGDMYGSSDPVMFFNNNNAARYIYVKTKPAVAITNVLSAMEPVFKKYNPAFPFEYEFVDDAFNAKFKSEQLIGNLSQIFAVLAIIISCLGLFGLSAYTAEQRRKEIGVRKVLGSSVPGIVRLLSKDFMRLVGVSILLAVPLAWWAMHTWLEGFAYRTEINWWVFALAGILAVFIALITVSFQAIKAAIANPVKSLRTE